jgi:pSer/pThr/pTyr-binding forkhead associated (FHA) protein
MLQVTVLGQAQATVTQISSYPFRIGRAPGDHLRIQAPGVWDNHITLEWRAAEGIHLVGSPESLTAVNGHLVKETRIRNGDLVQIGGVRLLLSVAPAAQRSFRPLEIVIWTALGAVGLAQLYLMLVGLP